MPEYYLTEAEKEILKSRGTEISRWIGADSVIVEYGCGNSEKIHLLLSQLKQPRTYVAIDISKAPLLEMTQGLANSYPHLEVMAVCADFTLPLKLPLNGSHNFGKRIAFFPGSSIGNFEPAEAQLFLGNILREVGPGGGLLIGVDLKKDPHLLHLAYNDPGGITAQFNKNLLTRVNRECDGNFRLDQFRHLARYNQEKGRIEMYLESLREQTVRIMDAFIPFEEGETIHTENSYKYNVEEFQAMARAAGWSPETVWMDENSLFSIHYLQSQSPSL